MQSLSAEQQQSGSDTQYLNGLRKSIFEAYSGIFQGLPRELVQQNLTGHASVSHFLHHPNSFSPTLFLLEPLTAFEILEKTSYHSNTEPHNLHHQYRL